MSLFSALDLSQMSIWVRAQLRLSYYLSTGGTSCFRELLAKGCLELMTGEIYLALCMLGGLNALKNKRGLRNYRSKLW